MPSVFRGRYQSETVLNMDLVLTPGCQPVRCTVIIGDAQNAVSTDPMTHYDVGTVIKCSGSHHFQRPPRHRYGCNENMGLGWQPKVIEFTVNNWNMITQQAHGVLIHAREICMDQKALFIHCNKGEVRVPAGLGFIGKMITGQSSEYWIMQLDQVRDVDPMYAAFFERGILPHFHPDGTRSDKGLLDKIERLGRWWTAQSAPDRRVPYADRRRATSAHPTRCSARAASPPPCARRPHPEPVPTDLVWTLPSGASGSGLAAEVEPETERAWAPTLLASLAPCGQSVPKSSLSTSGRSAWRAAWSEGGDSRVRAASRAEVWLDEGVGAAGSSVPPRTLPTIPLQATGSWADSSIDVAAAEAQAEEAMLAWEPLEVKTAQ